MTVEGKHRVLLVNFAECDVAGLTKAGFNIELGYLGTPEKHGKEKYLPYFFPRPLYEYEIYIYNSLALPDMTSRLSSPPRDLVADRNMGEHLQYMQDPPFVRIVFTGGVSGIDNLLLGGLPTIQVTGAHKGVSELWCVKESRTFQIPPLDYAISKLRNDIALPINQYISWPGNTYPFNHMPVVLTLNGDEVASYGSTYRQKAIYVVLPQMNHNATAVLKLLEVFVDLYPELFPDIKRRDWYDSSEFAFDEEKQIDKEVEAAIEHTQAFIETKTKEKAEIKKRYAFMKEILVATENGEPDARLSTKTRQVLEFLGFTVDDIDEKIKGAIRKEDFWVKDEDFIAITEVTGTKNKNPKIKEYNDLLGRMTTIFKRRDLVPDASTIQGLLVINHDIDSHPARRPNLYAGDAEEIVRAARDQDIGILSTVELYKIAIAVKNGVMSKGEARGLIKQKGRIEYTGQD
jgi:hypothetical protein